MTAAMTNLIDQTIAKTGLTPTYVVTDRNGNKRAVFRRGHYEVARISINHSDGKIHVYIGMAYGGGETSYTDSGDYKTARGAAQFLRSWNFTPEECQ